MKKKKPDERLSKIGLKIKETGSAAVSLYAPAIGAVCLRFTRGEQVSEFELVRLLDGVLGYCFEEEMVELFRKLCRAALCQLRNMFCSSRTFGKRGNEKKLNLNGDERF